MALALLALLLARAGHPLLPWPAVAAGLGLVGATLGWLWPPAVLPLYRALTLVTYPVGLVMSTLALGLILYLVLTPMGLVQRLMGRDALQLRRGPAQETNWQPRPPARPHSDYFLQH